MKNRYRVTILHGIGRLEARRRPFLWIFPRWQVIAIGQAEDLQQMCVRMNRSYQGTPPISPTGMPPVILS
jgi:hypothetical protein